MPSLILINQADYLLPQAVNFLTEGWEGGLLDLSGTVLVLPTQEARRRLHEALVRKAASREATLLPPVWRLPMQLTEEGCTNLAPASLEQITWITVISSMSSTDLRRLFPRKVPLLDPPRAAELSNSIRSLRGELSQIGMSLKGAATACGEDLRWKSLLSLEERYLQRITAAGFTDRITAQLEGALHPRLPKDARRLLILGVPDLPGVYDSLIPLIEAQGIQVEILAYDPICYGQGFFDPLGRPVEAWSELPIPIKKETIHLCLDRSEEAEKASLLSKSSGGKGTSSAIGVTGVDLAKSLYDALTAIGIPAFNPAGQTLDSLPVGRLLNHFIEALREDDFRSALQLLRHPDIQRWLGLDPRHDLEALDALATQLIPSSLADLLDRWHSEQVARIAIPERLKEALQSLLSLISDLRSGTGATPLLKTLQTIYSSANLTMIPGGRESAERIQSWATESASLMTTMRSPDLLTLLLTHLQAGIRTEEKVPEAVELPGWLELLWEDAPHLIVAGMNDGLVPEIRQEDPFLHEKLRISWGLSSDAGRLRRDSYLLLCLMGAREKNQGRLDLLLARQDDEGAILKPSRLLLRCAEDAALPLRVQELFRELPPRPSEKWLSAWALKPERKTPSRTLSASALRDYLACPTRFYLKQVLKLKTEKFGVEEADAATFGTLLHATLREFGNDPKLRNLREPEQIEASLVSLWKRLFDSRYGTHPSFPLIYQREAGIRRLHGAAIAQAAFRNEGWEIVACERSFRDFPLSGMRLNGQIDRIDRRITSTGAEWRILDYKSSDIEKDPNREHFRLLGKRDDPTRLASYECFELNKKTYRWTDLQLPIYRMVLLSEIAGGRSSYLELDDLTRGPVEAGYFLLPSKVGETKYQPFADMEEHAESARACLEGILRAIHQGIFWPPRQPKYDDFVDLLFDHLESDPSSGQQTLDPDNLKSSAQSFEEASA